MDRPRLFVAAELPKDSRVRLARSFSAIPLSGGFRRIPEEQLHITLKFLGATDVTLLPELIAALEKATAPAEAMSVEFGHVVLMPQHRPRVVACAVSAPQELSDLARSIDDALYAARIAQPERRIFRPHITLARVSTTPAPADVAALTSWQPVKDDILIDSISLFESVLKPSGPVYTILNTFHLA
ncbi:MAG: 2'-5' RNA ligase [Candidatus Komeilibacteria bacterium RIFCSPLOWO2_01_FULL_52_15]|uniref:RNA 2',3'-cyclic phosphodiesterase n=2 Tax=Candidatus Komeiliibacteriota TaxID=1817908 RepID=A0A1G2BMV0_9BACT|nr:MAG: 2'-5' RNA ligase [Candidatus Komeilibacteria bacterium RIFCSPHIGHO2_01_FULL_52_14]OGY90462.1 MAG: 2'-5' RNA ligase [Candidatus Komeilibacteria bacterium RIFCSPLOWO2_01_FULL_52_15]